MRPLVLLVAALFASTSGAISVTHNNYVLTANPQQGFKLVAGFSLAPESLKGPRYVLAEFKCNVTEKGTVTFRQPLRPGVVWGDAADQQAVLSRAFTGEQFRAGIVTAWCDHGKLVVSTGSRAALQKAFPDEHESQEDLEADYAADLSANLIFSPTTMKFFNVPLVFKGNRLTAPADVVDMSLGVTQGGGVQPLVIGGQATPVRINPALPYTLHAVLGGNWYNVTLSGGRVTAWKSAGS